MKVDIKEILWLIVMGLFYIGIGSLGYWFSPIYIFSFLLGVPLSLYIYKKGVSISSSLMILLVIIYLVVIGTSKSAIMTLLLIFIPAFLCGICYNKQKNLPKNIIMVSVAHLFGWIGILILWNFLYGIEIIPNFYSLTNSLQNQYLRELSGQYDLILKNSIFNQNPDNLTEGYILYRLAIKQAIYLIQYLFPSIIFIFGFFTSLFQVLLTKLILKALNWKSPSVKEITNIGFTPVTVGLLAFTWLIRSGIDDNYYPAINMVIDNVLVIFYLLMFIIGILFTIYVIKNSKTGAGLKVLVSILSILSMILSPFLFVLLGFFEAVFNFRKTERFL